MGAPHSYKHKINMIKIICDTALIFFGINAGLMLVVGLLFSKKIVTDQNFNVKRLAQSELLLLVTALVAASAFALPGVKNNLMWIAVICLAGSYFFQRSLKWLNKKENQKES